MAQKQQLAKDLYLHTDKTQDEIADILDVNRKTVYLWIKQGRWAEMKIAARQAPDMINQNIYNYIDNIDKKIRRRPIEEQDPTMEEVNKMYKLTRMSNLIDHYQVGAYMQAYEELIKYLSKVDLDLAKKVIEKADSYVRGYIDRGKYYLDNLESENISEVRNNLKRQDEEKKQNPAEETPEQEEKSTTPDSEKPEVKNPAPEPEKEPVKEPVKPATPETPDGAQWGIMGHEWGIDGAWKLDPNIPLKSATAQPHVENDNVTMPQNAPQKKNTENGALPQKPATELSQKEEPENEQYLVKKEEPKTENSQPAAPVVKKDFAYYAALPPDERLSPFREGNILWVNDPDDVNDNTRKMGDRIQRYPDMDHYSKFNARIYDMRIKMEAEEKIEKEKAKAIRDAEMEKLMNVEIYKGYKDLLRYMTADIREKVNVKGKDVNKMWFQYNLLQMELPESHRLLMTEAEFLRQYSIEATLTYMRRAG